MIRKRSIVAAIVLGSSMSATLAFGLVLRHIAWDGLLLGKDGSNIRGELSMVLGATAGTTAATVMFKGDVAGAMRPWHVHIGSCKEGGPVLGDGKAYPMLRVDSKGAASGKANLGLSLPDSGSFYVNVHESSTNMAKIVACGDLLLED